MKPTTCPRCHRPRRPALLTTSGKLFSFDKRLVLPTGRRGMMLAAGAAQCCCCVDQWLLPNADVTDGSWEDTTGGDGAGTLWNEIDERVAESDDAGSYIQIVITSTGNGDYDAAGSEFEVALADPITAPDTAAPGIFRPAIRIRATRQGVNPTFVGYRYKLMEGATLIASTATAANDFGSWTTWIFPSLTQAEKDSISDFANLRLRLSAKTNSVGTAITQYSLSALELFLECP